MTKDELKLAFQKAFQMGQDYWYYADHEFESYNKKSDAIRAKFNEMVKETIEEALAQPEPVAFSCLRCVTPKKCAIHGCSPNTWPSETPPQPWEKFCDSNCVWTDHHPDCKLAEQEPVAIPDCGEAGHADGACGNRECLPSFNRNTTPQRKPLTDEEIGAILEGVNAYGTRLYTFARAIEAAHGIKGEA